MCVCTKPGITAQPLASITVSAVCPLPPISAMRAPVMRRSARTMELRWSIVTSVPFLMRIDDMQTVYATRRRRKYKMIGYSPIILYFLRLLVLELLRGGFRSLRLFPNGQTELELHVSLDLSQHFGIISQCLLRVFPTLAQPLAFVGKPRATFLHDSLGRGEIE